MYLTEQGVTQRQMVAALEGNRLMSLVGDLTIRPDRDRYLRDEAAAEAGIDPDLVDRIWRAAGLAVGRRRLPFFSDSDVEILRGFAVGSLAVR